jgi:hypothetical protein
MPGTHDFGEVAYTLTDLLVAAYDPVADTYSTPISVADGQMLTSEPESDNDKMRGYGKITRLLSVPIGTKISIKAGGLDYDALAAIAGVTNVVSGTVGSYIRRSLFPAGGRGLPYFGVIGVAATDDEGVAVIGHRMVKLDVLPKIDFNGETNKFIVYETAGYSAIPSAYTDLFVMKTYEDSTDFTAPTTGGNFKTWFAAEA